MNTELVCGHMSSQEIQITKVILSSCPVDTQQWKRCDRDEVIHFTHCLVTVPHLEDHHGSQVMLKLSSTEIK